MVRKPKYGAQSFSKAELRLMSQLFSEMAETYDNHDDYKIEVSEENKDLAMQIVESNMWDAIDHDEVISDIEESKDEIILNDTSLYEYFAWRCNNLAKK